jgi:hypothetical protein
MADQAARTGREIILLAVRNAVLGALLLAALAYAVDYAVLRFRIAIGRNATGTVTVRPVYAVPQKNHSTEFLAGDTQDQTCVHSLFPHLGDSPCWYLARHKEQQINM